MGKTYIKTRILSIDFKGRNNQRYYSRIYPRAETLKFGLFICAARVYAEMSNG